MVEPLAFLSGGGDSARLIRERDWTGHPLGPPETWPDVLCVALSLVLNSPESIILAWGPELFFFFNDAYIPLLGPRLSWAMGERFDRVWSDGWEQAKPIIDEAMVGRARRFTDLPWKLDTDRGARDTWWSFSYSRVLDAKGAVAGLFILTSETTDRVVQDAALRDSEARYRALFNTIDEGFCVIEFVDGPHGPLSDYVHVEANPAYARHAGIPDVVGRKVRDMVPDEADGWVELYGGVLRTGQPIRFERDLKATGRHLDLSAFRVEPPDRRQVAVLFQDITKRVRAEEALATLNASLQTEVTERTRERDRIWSLTTDVMLVARFDSIIVAVNPAWTTLFGWGQDELIGRSFMEFVHPDDAASTRAAAGDLSAGSKIPRFENRYRHKDGSYRWLSWTAVPDEQFIHAIGRDFTAEKEQALALAKTEAALRQAQKMEAVGQLTGGIAHDFNNLVTAITGSLELLSARVAQGHSEDIERYASAARDAAKRAAGLTHRLLAFSRQQTLDPKATDLNRLASGMEDLIRRTVGPAHAIEVVAANELWPTLIDPPQLENALLNLCINARDAMPDGGRITIETANRTIDESAAREAEANPGQYVSLSVTDTGTGMAPEVLARAFDPFFTTKPAGEGTGLGLSMIYGFVRQSNGLARISSEVGRGTTVSVFLPRHIGDNVVAYGDTESLGVQQDGPGGTVLLVDDEAIIRMIAREVLTDAGYTAIEAHDGASAMHVLRSDERIDLLVTDVGLPGGMNGKQVAEAARDLRPDLRVLFITGYADTAIFKDEAFGPKMGVMTKPFDMDVFAQRVAEMIATPA